MTADERELKRLVGQRLPSHMEFVAARDRVLNELSAAPPHLQKARLTDSPTAVSWLRTAVPPAAVLRTAVPMAAAAALVIVVGAAMVWPRGVQAYAAGADGLQVTLSDDSRVEMRAHAEMTVSRASDGIQIDLKKGDIIVDAAKRRAGHLYVQTSDMTVATIVGTVFLVNAGTEGSRVGVIEGEVRVRERGTPLRRSGRPVERETRLRPGEQVATSPTIVPRPLTEDITWSRNANAHLEILESFRKGMAQTVGPLTPLAMRPDAGGGVQTPGAPAPIQATAIQANAIQANAIQANRVEFEEASVRACDPDNLPPTPPGARGGGANSFQMTPGRLYALCMTPAVMVRIAHGFAAMPDGSMSAETRRGRGWSLNQVSGQGANSGIAVRGGPDWARNERYSIEAVAGSEANADTMSGPMFRSLLERRFKLKTHIETEDVPVWTLTVAPGGLKIKPMPPDGCYENPPPTPGTRTPSPRTLEEVRGGAKPTCGVWAPEPSGGNAVLMVGGSTLEEFAGRLRFLLAQARVSDKTGVTDRFNFVFEFVPDDHGSIVSAVERQLGLRLEQARTPREYLVIDSIERPGPN